jgi:protein-disulfide isomerase/uncharacterized membrane protein
MIMQPSLISGKDLQNKNIYICKVGRITILRKKYLIVTIATISASVAGFILSTLLILEYFGAAPEAADAVCARGGGVNACTIVSTSPFASIKGIPLIGDVPTAVFGFIFYGFIASAVVNIIRRNDSEISQLYLLILILSCIAFAGDVALYLISVFVIKFVCPLCAGTYAATAIILLSSALLLKDNRSNKGESSALNIITFIRKYILTFALTAIMLAAAGIGIGSSARVIAQSKEASTYEDRLQKAIRQYEAAKITDISLNEAPVFGNTDSRAKFVIFFDFTCIHCMKEFLILEKMMKTYPGDMSLAYKFFTLNGDCGRLEKGRDDSEAEACIASAAAFCGHSQGKFIEYAKILFDNYHNKDIKFNEKTVRDAAKTAGLDLAGFDLCFGSKKSREFVKLEYSETERLDIGSTPTVYLNGKKLAAGSRKADILEGLLKYCIERSK